MYRHNPNLKEVCDTFGFMLEVSGKLLIYNRNNSSGNRRRMPWH
jgi:hypothetical protein